MGFPIERDTIKTGSVGRQLWIPLLGTVFCMCDLWDLQTADQREPSSGQLSFRIFLRAFEQAAYRDPDAAEAMLAFIGLVAIAQVTLQAVYGHMALKRARMLESISNSGLNPFSDS